MRTATLLFFVCFLLPHICWATDGKYNRKNYDLDYAYGDIYLSHFGMGYPENEKRLDDCIKNRYKDCLGCYSAVKRGRDYLLKRISEDPDRTFKITLDNILYYCNKDLLRDYRSNEHIFQAERYNLKISTLCDGPIISLYYFDQDKYDSIILERLKHAPPKVINEFFIIDYEWMYNRPDPKRWIRFLEKLPNNVMNKHDKAFKIKKFQKKKGDYEKFGIMLLDSNVNVKRK
jgi:hypothetical protein